MVKVMKSVRSGASGLSHNFGYVILGMLIGLLASAPGNPMYEALRQSDAPQAIPITADVELVPRADGKFSLHYTPYAPELTEAVWSVHAYARDDGERIYTYRGDGFYGPIPESEPGWTWHGFHQGFDPIAPPIPEEPFRLCVYYHSHPGGGARLERFGPFCTSYSDELELGE